MLGVLVGEWLIFEKAPTEGVANSCLGGELPPKGCLVTDFGTNISKTNLSLTTAPRKSHNKEWLLLATLVWDCLVKNLAPKEATKSNGNLSSPKNWPIRYNPQASEDFYVAKEVLMRQVRIFRERKWLALLCIPFKPHNCNPTQCSPVLLVTRYFISLLCKFHS